MHKIGTVCLKIAGRDAGQLCVVVEEGKDGKVLVDGAVRRRMVNVKHLEPTGKTVDVKKGADHATAAKALGIAAKEPKPRKAAEKPRQQRVVKAKAEKPAKKASAKKTEKKPAESETEKDAGSAEKPKAAKKPAKKKPAKKSPAKKK